jgi:flagellar basal body-associated protein FliL
MLSNDPGGGCAIILLILCVLALAAAVLVPQALTGLQDAQAQRDYARAAVIEAQTAQKEAQSEQHRREMQQYAITLMAFSQSNAVEIVIGGVLVLVAMFAHALWRDWGKGVL